MPEGQPTHTNTHKKRKRRAQTGKKELRMTMEVHEPVVRKWIERLQARRMNKGRKKGENKK